MAGALLVVMQAVPKTVDEAVVHIVIFSEAPCRSPTVTYSASCAHQAAAEAWYQLAL